MSRVEIFQRVLDPARVRAAQRQQEDYLEFCHQRQIPSGWTSVAIYLTALFQSGQINGPGLRYRLYLLDVAARIDGDAPPSADPDLRLYLRGLFREAELGSPGKGIAPLYVEQVRALVDAAMRPTLQQARDVCFLLVANATGFSTEQLRRLDWQDIRLRPSRAVITLPSDGRSRSSRRREVLLPVDEDPQLCPVRALRYWRRLRGMAPGSVFSTTGRRPLTHHLLPTARLLGHDQSRGSREPVPPEQLAAIRAHLLLPKTQALRDRALILCAFVGALGTREIAGLQVTDVQEVERGLLIQSVVRGGEPVALPRSRHESYCPAAAWAAWTQELEALDSLTPDGSAFPYMSGSVVRPNVALPPIGLNRIVRQRSREAGMPDNYSFSSLRMGFLRTAARVEAPEYMIARQAGLATLSSVARHSRRENLLRSSVAATVGL